MIDFHLTNAKVTMSEKKFTAPWIIATLVAVFGIIAPILWERYKSISRLELQLVSSTTLVERTDGLEKLHILYDGREVDRLTVLRFVLINSGRKSFQQENIAMPVTLNISGADHVLDAKVEKTFPPDVEAALNTSSATNNYTIQVLFPLLNQDDQIHFSVLMSGNNWELHPKARIAGLKALTYLDRTKELEKPPKRTPWTVYVVEICTFVFILAWLVSWAEVKKDRKLKALYLSKDASLPQFATKGEYLQFLASTFSYMTAREREPVSRIISLIPQEPIQVSDRQKIEGEILKLLRGKCASYSVRTFFFIAAVIGTWYVVSNILSR